ncbi:MAG: thioredoxin family protein [Acidobacteria bacterium]|jgi:thioredoxin-related protein|nr:thioredoxin family protein [Acidobacteriota bacterium]
MKPKIVPADRRFFWLLLAAALVLLAAMLPAQAPTAAKPAIYDPGADVKAQIAVAVKRAGAEERNVLLLFGGNWCPWCHRLHELFAADAAIRKVLAERYVLLLVDVGEKPGQPLNQDLVELYRVKGFGFPALAVLDKQGKLLCAQSTGVLEKGKGHDPARVLAFLTLQIGQ